MLKIVINLHKKEKRIKRKKNLINTKSTNSIRGLTYIRGLLDYHEQKYETAITHFSSILDKHHDAAYMATLASLKLNNHENAEFFLEKYAEHIDNWQESNEKEFAQKRIENLKEMINTGKIFSLSSNN